MDESGPSSLPPPPPTKPPVVRSAKACTVCRAAKMRCMGAEDGEPCNRCRKQNTECIFEKHRRGRKPGSKLSEASKMLRRLEKGLTTAKASAQVHYAPNGSAGAIDSSRSFPGSMSRSALQPEGPHEPSRSNSAIAFTSTPQWQSSPQQHASGTQQPIQYITIPEYQASQGISSAGSASVAGPQSAPIQPSRKRRSRSPDDKEDERLAHRPVSNVRGSEDDSEQDPSSEEEEDRKADESSDYNLFPAHLLAEENKRNSFFNTVLGPAGPESTTPNGNGQSGSDKGRLTKGTRGPSFASSSGGTGCPPTHGANGPQGNPSFGMRPKKVPEFEDPITAGLITEDDAKTLFELFFLRLNPFICLFDPVLHTVEHVRSNCPFLFTCLIMAGCKFWKPHLYPACQQLAADTCVKVFQYGLKSVGIIQSFACMTYWKEPDDQNTWTYVGYACRMAVELGLNRYVPNPPHDETDKAYRERRDRERTYLVLFVHDRSLSTQTGRHWMLPEDDLIRHSITWHESLHLRPEDVIVAAQVQLRRLAAETTDVFYLHKGQPGMLYSDINYEILLRTCNAKLTAWSHVWHAELVKAEGQSFHSSTLSFFRLHVRLFLNSFGLQSSMHTASRETPSLQALSNCYTSALQTLEIVTAEFAPIGMLRYVQESITVMTAYSAVFLLRLLRHSATLSDLHEEATQKIYDLISQTADVYQEAALMASSSGSAGYHARFLRSLVAKDLADKARAAERRASKSRDLESNNSSINASSPSLLPSPSNVIPSYHPPAHPSVLQAQFHSSDVNSTTPSMSSPAEGASSSSVPFSLSRNAPDSYGNMKIEVQNPDVTFQSALTAPIPLRDHSFQFSSPYSGARTPGGSQQSGGGSVDFRQYPPNSSWDQQNPSLADTFGQPEYQQLNGVSDADINYWRHMFVNLGFGTGQ